MKRFIFTLLAAIALAMAPAVHGANNIGKILTPLGDEQDVEVMFISKSMLNLLANRLPLDKLGDNIESIQVYSCSNSTSVNKLKAMIKEIAALPDIELLLKSKEKSGEIAVYAEPRQHMSGHYISFIYFRIQPDSKAQVILFNGDFTSDNVGTTVKTLP